MQGLFLTNSCLFTRFLEVFAQNPAIFSDFGSKYYIFFIFLRHSIFYGGFCKRLKSTFEWTFSLPIADLSRKDEISPSKSVLIFAIFSGLSKLSIYVDKDFCQRREKFGVFYFYQRF